MARRSSLSSQLTTIGLLAPLVVLYRFQKLALEASWGSATARGETLRMVAEKPLALLSAAVAFQAEIIRLWSRGAMPFSVAPFEAALIPVRRRVQANRRRLGRR